MRRKMMCYFRIVLVAAIFMNLILNSEQYMFFNAPYTRSFHSSTPHQKVVVNRECISKKFVKGRSFKQDDIQIQATGERINQLHLSNEDYSDSISEKSLSSFPSSREELNEKIEKLCQMAAFKDAESLLQEAETILSNRKNPSGGATPDQHTYTIILQSLASGGSHGEVDDDHLQYKHHPSHAVTSSNLKRMERIFQRMKDMGEKYEFCMPNNKAYSALILAWSKSYDRNAGYRCEELLKELWEKHNATLQDGGFNDNSRETHFVPLQSTYISTLTAIARSAGGQSGAERAEALLEEMEHFRVEYPHLRPTTICVNIVLHAWSKSGSRRARERCETILNRVEELYFNAGRSDLQMNTTTYNTVIDALAKSNERGSERRSEELLERMDHLSKSIDELRYSCQPDQVSFNSVLNCWARSRDPSAARRAESILEHMEKRYANGNSLVQADVTTYNTVLTAWARSRNKKIALTRIEDIIDRMEKTSQEGNINARPNAVSWNIYIDALAKSKEPDAITRATEVLEKMKRIGHEPGREDCRPDCVTYTSIIDGLANQMTDHANAAERAIDLLEEIEEHYHETGEEHLKPNIRLYTSVIHAIARSRIDPARAERIVERLEKLSEMGEHHSRPDCVCYDALINAFGWSNEKGRALKCYSIFEKMMSLYKSRTNIDAKPDIITCNSVLNACAYEEVSTDAERVAIIDAAVKTLEAFQSNAPKYGWPNHITYANTLMAIAQHVPDDNQRANLAETTFWQCCQSGHVSVLVITCLHRVLPWDRFSTILGKALSSQEGENLHFDFSDLPPEWTKFAPSKKEKRNSRPSRRSYSGARSSMPSIARRRKTLQT